MRHTDRETDTYRETSCLDGFMYCSWQIVRKERERERERKFITATSSERRALKTSKTAITSQMALTMHGFDQRAQLMNVCIVSDGVLE